MKLGLIVPWLCVAGSLCGLAFFYSASQQKEAELVTLRANNDEFQKVRAELDELKTGQSQASSDELTRLRKDNGELLRLRNEASQLRSKVRQLEGQVQSAQAQAQAQAVTKAVVAQQSVTVPGLPPGVTQEQANAALCKNNLRLIDAAKQQWASVNNKPNGALLSATDIAPYLPNNTVPACPAGGTYTLNPAGYAPICTVPGHAAGK